MTNVLRLPSMPSLGSLLRLYKVRALKQLSQNFLLEPRLIDKFVKAAGPLKNGIVCEVGPGPGGISRCIIEKGAKDLFLVEKDTRFRPILEALCDAARNHCRVDAIYADILDFNMAPFLDESYKKEWQDNPPNIHVMGNLPFDVSTILIVRWLRDISLRQNYWSYGRVKMTLTFQEEVAERMVAPVLAKQRCRLSIMCQNWCEVVHKFTIPGRAFLPKPDVNVGVVHFVPRIRPLIPFQFEIVEKVVRTIFSSRQRYIARGIKNLFPMSVREEIFDEIIKKTEVDPTSRSYQLTIPEFRRIISAYKEICDRNPSYYRYNFRGLRKTREISWMMNDEEDGEEDVEDEIGNVSVDLHPSVTSAGHLETK